MYNQTVRPVLWERGYHERIKRKRPFVSRNNKIVFAMEHINKETSCRFRLFEEFGSCGKKQGRV